ncbi:MAG: FHA domain-containing protein [Pyrinomonadaceae bacterium]
MPKAKLIVNNEREVEIEDGVIAVGRASDNTIAISDDSNVSRYHIEIETRAGDFWLVELGSSNGTPVGGEKVHDERKLADGDLILLGGTSEILFEIEKEKPVAAPETAPQISSVPTSSISAPAAAIAPPAEIAADTAKASKMPVMLTIMGIICGLAVVAVVVALAVSFIGGGQKCQAKAVITSPENGDTIKKQTDIEVESQNDDCAQKAIFLMDGKEFASAAEKPFNASLDPSEFPDLSDGGTHSLKIALEDAKGEKILQPGDVQLYFDTLATPTPTPEASNTPEEKTTPKQINTSGKTVSVVEIQGMIQNLLKEFKGLPAYKFDPQFLQEVQKKTAEYAADGYFARAQNYNEAIKVVYIQGAGLDAPLGYILAMSRTQFKLPNAGGAEEGLWRMNAPLVAANGYNGTCEGESLSDAKQNCAARSSALYMKAMLVNVFENDLIYAVAAFGMTTQKAAIWKNTLPQNRADFWSVRKSPKQREEVVRFFAAGIVAENPQKFGLKKDAPISALYKNYLVK